jgi:cytochrome c oxidase assembly protein subunit 15
MAFRLSPARYRIATMAALVFLYAIVVTGALVRLTGSGLGCADWPNCNADKFVDVSSQHAAIEQVNRLFTGAVAVAVMLAVLGSVLRRPRRRDLVVLSLGLVAGVAGQAVLGAFVVWSHLNPVLVQGHFLLSMILMATAIALHRRAGQPDGGRRVDCVPVAVKRHAWLVTGLTAVALVTGTVTTGAGPHSGSVDGEPVRRFDVAVSSAARLHSMAVWATVAVLALLMWRARTRRAQWEVLRVPTANLLLLAVMQGFVGYVQYFSGVPTTLVAIHVALATGLWLAAVHLGQSTTTVEEPVLTVPVEEHLAAPASPTGGPVRPVRWARSPAPRH